MGPSHSSLRISTGIDSRDRPDSNGEQAVHHYWGLYPAAVSGMEWPRAISGVYRVRPGIPAANALGCRQVVVEEAKSGARGRRCRTPSRQHTEELSTRGIMNNWMANVYDPSIYASMVSMVSLLAFSTLQILMQNMIVVVPY